MSSSEKICTVCSKDCSQITRYQTPDGRYICEPCYASGALASPPPSPASTPPPPPPPAPMGGLRIASAHSAAGSVPTAPAARPSAQIRAKPRTAGRSPLPIAGAVLLLFVLIVVLARFVPIVAPGYFLAYGLLVAGVGIAVLVSAFRTSLTQGLLTFFVPFYGLYYVYGVSRNKLLMTLVPLCLTLWAGVFLLPMEKAGFEMTSRINDSAAEPAILSSSLNSDETRSERVIAGHPVAIIPRANTSSYNTLSGPNRITMRSGGKNVVLQCNQPLQIEGWNVGDQHVMIANDELIVNLRHYGKLTPGSQILVDHGTVLIGGKPAVETTGDVKITVSF